MHDRSAQDPKILSNSWSISTVPILHAFIPPSDYRYYKLRSNVYKYRIQRYHTRKIQSLGILFRLLVLQLWVGTRHRKWFAQSCSISSRPPYLKRSIGKERAVWRLGCQARMVLKPSLVSWFTKFSVSYCSVVDLFYSRYWQNLGHHCDGKHWCHPKRVEECKW